MIKHRTLSSVVFLLAFALFQSNSEAPSPDEATLEATRVRVLEILFPREVKPRPYYIQLVLRYSDVESQLVLTNYFGGHSDLVKYSLGGMNGRMLTHKISDMLHDNPHLSDQEIASHFTVTTDTLQIEEQQINPLLTELKRIRISPFFDTRVSVDEISQFDFWLESQGESVHYVIFGPFTRNQQDKLTQWMLRFRKRFN